MNVLKKFLKEKWECIDKAPKELSPQYKRWKLLENKSNLNLNKIAEYFNKTNNNFEISIPFNKWGTAILRYSLFFKEELIGYLSPGHGGDEVYFYFEEEILENYKKPFIDTFKPLIFKAYQDFLDTQKDEARKRTAEANIVLEDFLPKN